jgi:hypothetical protein
MRSAVPLGGLGAGTFELRADGTIHEWTVHEASPAGNAKLGTMGDALLGVRVAGGGVAGGAAARALRTGGVGSAASAAEGVDAITYSGSWPLARLAVADGALDAAAGGPLGLALFAYSRFVPGDVNASAAPSVTFTLRATNPSTTEPLNLSLFLSLPLSATNDCWGGSGEKTTVLPVPSWAACRAACAAAAATDCAAWWFDGLTATCTLDPGLFLVGYKAGATCGVRGAWAVAPLPRSGAPTLTLTQAPAPCAPGARNPSPWCGDYALAAGEGEAGAFAAGDSLADMWRAFAGNGTPGAPPQPGTAAGIGAVVATVTLPPGATGTATVVFAWWLPNRDFLGETVGAWYQNLFVSAGDAADAAAGAAAQVQAVADINAHHAVWAGSSEPDWLKDIAINSYSHSRNAFYMADGRWRQWEAFDCDDSALNLINSPRARGKRAPSCSPRAFFSPHIPLHATTEFNFPLQWTLSTMCVTCAHPHTRAQRTSSPHPLNSINLRPPNPCPRRTTSGTFHTCGPFQLWRRKRAQRGARRRTPLASSRSH